MSDIAVGIDHSLSATGCAVLRPNEKPRLRTFGPAFKTPTDASMTDELRRIQYVAGKAVGWILEQLEPDDTPMFMFEGPIPHMTFSGKTDERGGLRWIMAINLAKRGRVTQVPPSTVKKFWTGNGSADKTLMKTFAALRYPGQDLVDDNAVDGLALATMGALYLGIDLISEPPAPDRTQLHDVRWPATITEGTR